MISKSIHFKSVQLLRFIPCYVCWVNQPIQSENSTNPSVAIKPVLNQSILSFSDYHTKINLSSLIPTRKTNLFDIKPVFNLCKLQIICLVFFFMCMMFCVLFLSKIIKQLHTLKLQKTLLDFNVFEKNVLVMCYTLGLNDCMSRAFHK